MAKVKHVVLLKFKPGVSEEQAQAAIEAVRGLEGVIGGIEDFLAGTYSSPEGLNQGYTHGFIMTFESAEARNGYLDHPEHERVKNGFFPLLDGAIAFDFEVSG